jgi:hypothetical protein
MPSNKELDVLLIDRWSSEQSKEDIQKYLDKKQALYDALEASAAPIDRARLQLDVAEAMVGLGRADESWEKARSALDTFVELEEWQDAVECCDVLYQSAQPASMVALGHGAWLSVTYPVDPTLTVNMMSYIVDETPATADGAAVAATVAHYVADVRAEADKHKSLTFLTKQMLANVASGHSDVKDQDGLTAWMERLELLDPDVFLPRLSLVLGAIVPPDDWWFDRDALREKIPQ